MSIKYTKIELTNTVQARMSPKKKKYSAAEFLVLQPCLWASQTLSVLNTGEGGVGWGGVSVWMQGLRGQTQDMRTCDARKHCTPQTIRVMTGQDRTGVKERTIQYPGRSLQSGRLITRTVQKWLCSKVLGLSHWERGQHQVAFNSHLSDLCVF